MKKKNGKILSFTALALLTGLVFSAPFAFANAKAEEGGVRTVASYFSVDENATFSTNADTPSYVAEKRNGVLVTSSEGGVFTYENLIDAEKLTKDNLLFEMQVTPQTAGEYELNQFIVRLEDAEDARVYVNISLYNYLYGGTNLHGILSQVTVKTNTVDTYRSLKYNNKFDKETQKDKVTTNLKTGVKQGTEIYAPMAGNKGGHSEPFKLYYDNAENALYTVNDNVYADPTDADPKGQRDVLKEQGIADEEGRFLVVDLDDHAHMGMLKANLFTGFPSGKVRLSVTTNEIVGESASYTVLTVDGQTTDGEYLNDITAPELLVDTLGYTEENLPVAKVGKEYPVFSASAVDKMYGDLNVSFTVLKDGDTFYCTKDGFVPSEAGEYEICYEASDGNGNKATKILRVNAVDTLSLAGELCVVENEYDFNDESLKNANGNFQAPLYYPVYLPSMNAIGGSGDVQVETSVRFAGKAVQVVGGEFLPTQKGVYEISYILRDYAGNSKTYEYFLETVYSDTPNLYEPNIPTHLTYGQATLLPAVHAELYTPWWQETGVYATITVYQADGETVVATFDGNAPAIYIPKETDGESVIIEYLAAKDKNSTPVVYQQEVLLLSSGELSNKFVVSGGVEMKMGEEGDSFDFFFTGEDQNVAFVNKLSIAGGLHLEFNVPKGKNGYGGVTFTFVDAEDATRSIAVSFFKNPNQTARTSFISVDGGVKADFPASFHGNVSDYFVFTVTENGEVYNFNDDIVAKAENFGGFTSKYVYVSMSAFDVETESEKDAVVAWITVKNQNLNMVSEYKDLVDPALHVFAQPVGRAELGEKLYVSGAIACDVYAEQTLLVVTVTFAGEEILKIENQFGKFDGAWFTATDYGEYSISYTAVDTVGNDVTRSYTVEVLDTVSPTIVVDGEFVGEATVGKELKLPKAKAVDNKDVGLTVYVVIIDPMNVYTVFEQGEKYIVPYVGRYIVKYYVEDEQCNTAYSEEFLIYVQ